MTPTDNPRGKKSDIEDGEFAGVYPQPLSLLTNWCLSPKQMRDLFSAIHIPLFSNSDFGKLTIYSMWFSAPSSDYYNLFCLVDIVETS